MRNSNGVIRIGIIGLIVIVFSLAAFFLLDIERIPLHWWALTFLVLSEVVLFSGLVVMQFSGANHSRVFMKSGVTTTLSLYFVATLISVFLANSFQNNSNAFILLELFIIALFAIIIITILAFSRRFRNSDEEIVRARSFMDLCEKRIYTLLVDTKNNTYKEALSTIYETFKYSDKIGTSFVDGKIDESIRELETLLQDDLKGKEDVMGIFDRISSLLCRRKEEIGESKRGGF